MKINKMKLKVMDNGNKIIMENKLINMPLKEEMIIQLSKDIFGDPEPCMIHRSAVMKKMYVEIYEYFFELLANHKEKKVCT